MVGILSRTCKKSEKQLQLYCTALESINYFTSFILYVSADGKYNSRIQNYFISFVLLVVELSNDFTSLFWI